jgi:hypothetical protein
MVMSEKAKSCRNCGFLFIKRRTQLGLHEYEEQWRELGSLVEGDTLLCFRNVAKLYEEVDDAERAIRESTSFHKTFEDDSPRRAAVRRVERGHADCPKWYEYVPYFGPQWHYEKMHMEGLEEANRANAKMIAELDLRSQESMRSILEASREIEWANQQVFEEHAERFERSDKQTFRFQVGFVVLALITLVLALVPLAYPNGINWLVERMPGAASTPD